MNVGARYPAWRVEESVAVFIHPDFGAHLKDKNKPRKVAAFDFDGCIIQQRG